VLRTSLFATVRVYACEWVNSNLTKIWKASLTKPKVVMSATCECWLSVWLSHRMRLKEVSPTYWPPNSDVGMSGLSKWQNTTTSLSPLCSFVKYPETRVKKNVTYAPHIGRRLERLRIRISTVATHDPDFLTEPSVMPSQNENDKFKNSA